MAIEGFSPPPSPPSPYYQLLERGSARLGRVKNLTCKRLSVGVSWCKSFMILLLSFLLFFFVFCCCFFYNWIGSINNLWVFFKVLEKIYWIFCQLFIKHSEWWRSKRKDGFRFSLKVYFLRSGYFIIGRKYLKLIPIIRSLKYEPIFQILPLKKFNGRQQPNII